MRRAKSWDLNCLDLLIASAVKIVERQREDTVMSRFEADDSNYGSTLVKSNASRSGSEETRCVREVTCAETSLRSASMTRTSTNLTTKLR